MGNEEPEDLDTEQCITCGNTLAPSWCDKECFACIARGEDLQNEAADAEEGREECEAEPKPVWPGLTKDKSDELNMKLAALTEPDRMIREGREYYRLADGVELSETDRHTFNRALFGPIHWPRRQGQVSSGNMALGNEYWRPVELDAGKALELLGKALDESGTKLTWTPPKVACGSCADLRDMLSVSDEINDVYEEATHENVQIPKDLAKLVLAELSPQWHTKAVRELLRTIEEQL